MANKPADQSKYSSYKSNKERYAAGIVPQGKDLLRRLVLAEAGGEELLGQALVANSLFNRIGLTTGGKGIGSSAKIGARPFYDSSGASKTIPFSKFHAVPRKWVKGKRVPTNKYELLGKIYDGKARKPDANSVDSFILATNQYQPIQDGRIWEVGSGKDHELTAKQIADADAAIELAKNTGELKRQIMEGTPALGQRGAQSLLQATGFRTQTAKKDLSQTGPGKNNVSFGNHVFTTAGNDLYVPSTTSVEEESGGAGVDPSDLSVEVAPSDNTKLEGTSGVPSALEVEGEEPGNIESIIRAYEYADKLSKPERRSKVGESFDVISSMVGLGPDRKRVVQAGDTAAEIARELGVRVEDLGGLGDDPDLIYPEQVLTAPPEDTTLEEDWEELKKIWGLYEGGVVDHSNVSSRIQNIMKPKD